LTSQSEIEKDREQRDEGGAENEPRIEPTPPMMIMTGS